MPKHYRRVPKPAKEKKAIPWPILRFGLVFMGLMIVFYVVSALNSWNDFLYIYLKANASISSFLLNVMGQQTTVNELIIRNNSFAIAVKRGCDAVEPAWLFTAAVMAFPVPWKKKIPGVLVGVVIILLLNLVRIMSLYYIGLYFPPFFETTHLEIWPAIFILMAVILWAVWLQWTKRHDSPKIA